MGEWICGNCKYLLTNDIDGPCVDIVVARLKDAVNVYFKSNETAQQALDIMDSEMHYFLD